VDDIEPEPSRKNNWPDDAGAKAAMEKFKKQRNVVPWFGFKEVTMEHRSTYFLRWFGLYKILRGGFKHSFLKFTSEGKQSISDPFGDTIHVPQ